MDNCFSGGDGNSRYDVNENDAPPAGADPIIVILGANSWSYLVTPVLIGSVVIVVIALFINNMSSKRNYPTFWM